jgi:serine/threonine protein kinase HipA of HipAB toxin-antitoxin module
VKSNDAPGVYWIERFDRQGQGDLHRFRCKDVYQLLGVPTSFKYKYVGNCETLRRMIREHCSHHKLQLARLFHRVLFCWEAGNGDMYLKSWPLVENAR